jgi:hypothetical protein
MKAVHTPLHEVCEKLAERIGKLDQEISQTSDSAQKIKLEKELELARAKYARDCAGHSKEKPK